MNQTPSPLAPPPQSKIRCVATALVKGAKPNRVIQFKCGKVLTHAKL